MCKGPSPPSPVPEFVTPTVMSSFIFFVSPADAARSMSVEVEGDGEGVGLVGFIIFAFVRLFWVRQKLPLTDGLLLLLL